jgi:RND family efflux transporter MFP subunit
MVMTCKLAATSLFALLPLVALSSCAEQGAGAPTAGRPPTAVTVATAATSDLAISVDVVGSLAPKFEVDIKSEISGLVKEVFVTEWVSVSRGDRLARLDTRETEAGIEALCALELQARVAETRARREHERATELKKYGLITPQSFDDAVSAVKAAEAATAAASAQVKAAEAHLAKALITAPMSGVVSLRGVNVGDRVENMGGGPMFRIVDNRLLDLTVSVPSSRVAEVRVGQPLEFTTDVLPGRTFTGKVMFINPTIDEASRSARVIAEVVNRDGALKSGAFVKGRILVATRQGVLQVPREALLNWSLERRSAEVFVVGGDQVEKRSVTTGMMAGERVEVASGLSAGERVVTRGGFALRSGDRVSVEPGEGA